MDSSTPPAKRLRTDDSAAAESPSVVRSSEIWYPDGNIILQAGATQFRVHKSLLAKQSTVFSDMLEVGSSQGSDTIEGCPVVELSDGAEDVQCLLEAIYDRSTIFTRDFAEFRVISSLVRLARKYDAQRLYNDARECLLADFPTGLSSWDRCRDGWLRIDGYKGLQLDCIRLLRNANLAFLTPQAYLECADKLTLSEISSGVDGVDGMPYDVFKTIVEGRQNLRDACVEFLDSWASSQATDVPACPRASSHACSRPAAAYTLNQVVTTSDFLSTPWRDAWAKSLCKTCAAAFREYYMNGRVDLWRRLPSFYGLPEWEELLKENSVSDAA